MRLYSLKTHAAYAFVGLFFIGFFIVVLLSNTVAPFLKVFLGLAVCFLFLGLHGCFRKYDQKTFSLLDSLNIVAAGFLGAVSTYYLTQYVGVPVVISASLIGVLGYLLNRYIVRYKGFDPSIVMYCGTFVGMASTKVLSLGGVSLAGLLSGILFLFLCDVFNGYGGKLGSIAFMSCVITITVIQFFHLPL